MRDLLAAIKRFRQSLPVFWQTLLLMLALIFLSMTAMFISSRISVNILTENYLNQAQTKLEQDLDSMSTKMRDTFALPKAIEISEYYHFVQTADNGQLPLEYTPYLTLMQKNLINLLQLQSGSMESVVYFTKSNSIISRKAVYRAAETCFSEYLVFSDIRGEDLLALLGKKNSFQLLPMQDVTVRSRNTARCMGLIAHPIDSNAAVLTLYEEEAILKFLGMSSLPEGTHLLIEDVNGNMLFSYPSELEMADLSQYNVISQRDTALRCKVTMYVPQAYFSQQAAKATAMNVILLAVMVLISVVFAVNASHRSTKPIKKLVTSHQRDGAIETEPFRNEVVHLSSILEGYREKTDNLQNILRTSLMIHALSGAPLTQEDQEKLQELLQTMGWPCRLALFHAKAGLDALLLLLEKLPETFFYQAIGTQEAALLLPYEEDALTKLQSMHSAFSSEQPGTELYIGISSMIDTPSGITAAVRQARFAMPETPGVGQFTSTVDSRKKSYHYATCERYYQHILNGNEEDAKEVLMHLTKTANRSLDVRGIFYSIKFMLRSAADTLDIELPSLANLDYNGHLQPIENMSRLIPVHMQFFQQVQLRKEKTSAMSQEQSKIMAYIQCNYTDYTLSAASVAQAVGCSERRVYDLVKALTGQTVNEYILFLRMQRVGELLLNTDSSADEIAQQCGYQVESTFYRAFRRYYHTTPAQYRKLGGVVPQDNSPAGQE